MKNSIKSKLLTTGMALFALCAFADPETGWKQTGAGPYDYNDTANWVNGDINGIFGSDLTLTAAQTITFAADTTLTNGLTINYAGNYAMTFQSNGTGAKTLTLGGDISEALQGTQAAVVTIGGSGDDALVLDFAGENRTITAAATVSDVSKSGILSIPAVIQNGALTIDGAKKLKLSGANTYAGGTTIAGATYLYVNSATALGTGDVSINAAANLCSDATRTMTANNNFYINATDWYFRGGSALDIGTGDMVATNSFKLWAEADGLTIHGPIVDKDGNLAPWKLEKWGSKSLNTYSYATMSGDESFVVGNGIWNFYGEISGSGFSVDGSVSTFSKYFKLKAANSFSGTLSLEGDNLFVHADVANAIPSGAVVAFGQGVAFVGSSGQKVSDLLADGKVSTDSNGTICLGSSESGAIDLSGHPGLVLGAKGGTYDCTGTITWPASGTIRLGGGGDALKFSVPDTIPEGRDIDIVGKLFIAASNSTAGKIRVVNGGLLIIDGAAGTLPNAPVVVEQGGELSLRSSVACDVTRANNVMVKSGTLSFEGNKTYAVVHRITKLTLMTMPGVGGTPQLTWSSKDSKQTTLRIGSVERPDYCFLNVSGGAPGLTNFESGWNVVIGAGVANTTEGTVATTTAPFVPWIRNGLTKLVYNDPTTGLRFHTDDERQLYSSAYSDAGPVAQGENMLINYSGNIVFTGENATVATFSFGSTENQYFKMPDGVLRVTSGVIGCTYNKVHPQVSVDLCNQHGYILGAYNRAPLLEGSIGGTTKGLTIANDASTRGNTIEVRASGTYSGDVYIHGGIWNQSSTFLPGGPERPGNTIVEGYWRCGNVSPVVNGICGAGFIEMNNDYHQTITCGADGSNGDFEGRMQRNTKGTLSLAKVGAGRQRMGGECTHNGATTVSAGVLQVDGAFTQSAVTVAEGATLAGVGSFGKAVTLADGAKLEVGSAKLGAEDSEMNLDAGITLQGNSAFTFKALGRSGVASVSASSFSGAGTVTVNVDAALQSGEYLLVKSDAAIPFAYAKGSNCGALEFRNEGTELWMTKNGGLSIIVR